MKIKKLNPKGFTHEVLVLVFVVAVAFAIAGVAYLVASHADAPAGILPGETATVQIVTGAFTRCNPGQTSACGAPARYVSVSHQPLFVVALNNKSAKCNTVNPVADQDRLGNISGGGPTSIRWQVRTLHCTPGNYQFWLNYSLATNACLESPPKHNGHQYFCIAKRSAPNNALQASKPGQPNPNAPIYLLSNVDGKGQPWWGDPNL